MTYLLEILTTIVVTTGTILGAVGLVALVVSVLFTACVDLVGGGTNLGVDLRRNKAVLS